MSIIGKEVTYSIQKRNKEPEMIQGVVLDKINMKSDKSDIEDQSSSTITGYLIHNIKEGKVYPIAYWRIKTVK